MDMSAITGAYTSLKAMKEVGAYLLESKIDKEAEKKVSEAFEKIGAIQDTLFYIREELLRLQEENRELKEQNRTLEEKLVIKQGVVYKAPSYWVEKDDTTDGPFCQQCYDSDQKLVRLQGGHNDAWYCHGCKTQYYGPQYQKPQRHVSLPSFVR